MDVIGRVRGRAAMVAAGVAALVLWACDNGASPDPNVPQLTSPVAGAVLDNGCVPNADSVVWDFDWAEVPGATSYHLFVANFAQVFATVDDSTLTATSFHFSRSSTYMSSTTGWSWWVRAEVDGVWHDWAGPRDFSLEAVSTDCPEEE